MARSFVDHRWDSPRKLGFAPDSPLEGDGFELPVPQGRPDKQRRQPSTQFLCGTELRSSPNSLPEGRDSNPSVPGAKGGFRALWSHAMSGSYRLSAPLSPLQEINGRHGSQAPNVSPVWLAKLHISRDGPERRLLRQLAGPGPD